MIKIQLNGKTREISIDDWLERDVQDIIADDIGIEDDALNDFNHELADTIILHCPSSIEKDIISD